MEFLKLWLITLTGSILVGAIAVLSYATGIIIWAILPPITHLFTEDGNKFTANLLERIVNKFTKQKEKH